MPCEIVNQNTQNRGMQQFTGNASTWANISGGTGGSSAVRRVVVRRVPLAP